MLMLGPKKILVVGDVILDISCKGKVNRVSPEAPIPALLYEEMEYSLGGAANLTSNLIAAGQDVTLVSIIGSDKYPFASSSFPTSRTISPFGSRITKLVFACIRFGLQ